MCNRILKSKFIFFVKNTIISLVCYEMKYFFLKYYIYINKLNFKQKGMRSLPPRKKVEVEQKETFPQVEFSDIMQRAYIDYAINVIVDRALPDVRDGLKPVQRRVLWDLYDLRVFPDKPYKKCARIVGDTLGRWHPHGDSSVYGALVHMAQDWKLNNVLIDGHGNFGSLDGDPEAAMRYTECRLSPIGMSMIESISSDVVEYRDNYTSEEKEPTILPCQFPNLFLNGTEGIAVGMRSEIPTHNLGELVDGILAYMKKPKITIEELTEIIPGPDYPTGATIINKNELIELYKTGVGKIIIRAKIEQEKGENGRTNLIVTEIPYTLSGQKEKLKDNLISLMKDKKLEEIADLRDESDAEGVRIVLEVKKGIDIPNLINKLYKKSRLQDTEACNFLVVNGQIPKQVGLKSYFEEFVAFQEEIYTKKYQVLLEKALRRQEMNDGLLRAFDMVDVIIETIRYAKNVATAKDCLMTGNTKDVKFKTKKSETTAKTFNFSELQAQYILDMKLQRLNNLEINQLHELAASLKKEIEGYQKILGSKKNLHAQIAKTLKELKDKYAKPRKTVIVEDNKELTVVEAAPVVEDVMVLIDRFGYIKTVDMNSYSRTGEESLSMYRTQFQIKNTEKIGVFTKSGNLYQLKVSELPRCKIKDKGQPLDVLCKFKEKETTMLIAPLTNGNVVFVFQNGYVKNVPIAEYESRQKLTIATRLYNSEILEIFAVSPKQTLVFKTTKKETSVNISKIEIHAKNIKGSPVVKLSGKEKIESVILK